VRSETDRVNRRQLTGAQNIEHVLFMLNHRGRKFVRVPPLQRCGFPWLHQSWFTRPIAALEEEVHPVVPVICTGRLLSMQRSQRDEITRINGDSEFLSGLTNSSFEDRLAPLNMPPRRVGPMAIQIASPLAQLEQDLLTSTETTTEQHIHSGYQPKAIIHTHTVAGDNADMPCPTVGAVPAGAPRNRPAG
jgi:hypothetical protein